MILGFYSLNWFYAVIEQSLSSWLLEDNRRLRKDIESEQTFMLESNMHSFPWTVTIKREDANPGPLAQALAENFHVFLSPTVCH